MIVRLKMACFRQSHDLNSYGGLYVIPENTLCEVIGYDMESKNAIHLKTMNTGEEFFLSFEGFKFLTEEVEGV